MLKYFSGNAEMRIAKHTQYSNFGGKRGIFHSSLLQNFSSICIRGIVKAHCTNLVEVVRDKEYSCTVLCLSLS